MTYLPPPGPPPPRGLSVLSPHYGRSLLWLQLSVWPQTKGSDLEVTYRQSSYPPTPPTNPCLAAPVLKLQATVHE